MKTKTQTLPKKLEGQIDIYDSGAVVKNELSGGSIELNALELSMYDLTMGAERLGQWDIVQLCTDWFRKNNSKAYRVLLD